MRHTCGAQERYLTTASSLGLPLSWIFPCRLWLWRERLCCFSHPQGGGLWWEEGCEQGAVPAPCRQAQAGTMERMCKNIRGT